MAFTGMLCRFTISYDSLLLQEHVPRTQGSQCLEHDCFEHHGEMLLCEMAHVGLFFLTGGAEIVNAHGSDKY